jgi:hypothetical protein
MRLEDMIKPISVISTFSTASEVRLFEITIRACYSLVRFKRNKVAKNEKFRTVFKNGVNKRLPMDAETLACRLYAM